MPPPVRRFVNVLVLVGLLALVLAGLAAAGNGGLAPPEPASPNAADIRSVYWLILLVTGGIFVLVEGALFLFVIRYRSRGRPREIEGPQVRGHTNLELAWTAGPVVILAVIAEQIRVEGHQFYWEFVYPNGAISIDRLKLPYKRAVRLHIVSDDVNHSWWVPALDGKLDAIPGKANYLSFLPDKLGTFTGQCAEFCGVQHAAMIAHVEVVPRPQYEAYVRERAATKHGLGKEIFVGVCAKCHGLAGQGQIGPAIAQSPILQDRQGLTTLLRNGRGLMPAVGKNWTDDQIDTLRAYLKQRFGGGSGS
jgi:cytochrome c oxidase subunit II